MLGDVYDVKTVRGWGMALLDHRFLCKDAGRIDGEREREWEGKNKKWKVNPERQGIFSESSGKSESKFEWGN